MANVLGELFGDIATAIRSKTGEEGTMKPAEFPKKIKTIGLTTVYELQSVTGFQFDSTFGAFSPGFVSPSEFVLKPKENYIVCWDDVDYTCEAFSFALSGMSIVAIGNASSLGLSGNGEPFLITYNVTANNTQFHSTEQDAEHTIGIYTPTESQSGGSSDDLRYVTFMSYDGSVEYGKKAVATGDDCADPIARGVFDTPTRESTAQYSYTFSGWATVPNGGKDANALKAVNEDRTVYANYVSAVRYYTITFYDSDGTTVLTTKSVAYGSVPSYTPEKDGSSFIGWSPELVAVTGNASYSAQWEERVTFANGSWADIAQISEEGRASEYFNVGDTRTLRFGSADITLAIAGFNHDDLADGSGKAGMTIVTMNVSPLTKNWHWSDGSYCLYDKCDLSQKYLPEWFNSNSYIPKELRTHIKSVNKEYDTSSEMGNASLGVLSCNLFVLSLTELGGKPYNTSNTSVLGKRYALFPELSATNTAPTANKAGTSTKVNYWIRNLNRVGEEQPVYISTDGSYKKVVKANVASTTCNVRFGFCI